MGARAESALAALFAALPFAADAKARDADVPVRIPATGFAILRAGTRGAPVEEFLSPRARVYRHEADLQLMVRSPDGPTRSARLAAMEDAIAAALAADPTLGGAVDGAEFRAGDPREDTEDGDIPVRVADAAVILEYMEED